MIRFLGKVKNTSYNFSALYKAISTLKTTKNSKEGRTTEPHDELRLPRYPDVSKLVYKRGQRINVHCSSSQTQNLNVNKTKENYLTNR